MNISVKLCAIWNTFLTIVTPFFFGIINCFMWFINLFKISSFKKIYAWIKHIPENECFNIVWMLLFLGYIPMASLFFIYVFKLSDEIKNIFRENKILIISIEIISIMISVFIAYNIDDINHPSLYTTFFALLPMVKILTLLSWVFLNFLYDKVKKQYKIQLVKCSEKEGE